MHVLELWTIVRTEPLTRTWAKDFYQKFFLLLLFLLSLDPSFAGAEPVGPGALTKTLIGHPRRTVGDRNRAKVFNHGKHGLQG